VLAQASNFTHQPQGSNNGAQNFANNQTNPLVAIPPVVPPSTLDPAIAQQLLLIKKLTDAGVTHDQIPGVIAALGNQGVATMLGLGSLPPPPSPQFPIQNQVHNAQNGQNVWGANGRPEDSRDRNGFRDGARSPGRNPRRSRSRSPARAWNVRDSPASRRREEPSYDYERNSPGRNRDDRGRGAVRGGRMNNDYRQRSPPRRRSSTPPRAQGGEDKWIGHDSSIGKGNIKGILNMPRSRI
jgi:protein NRD1